jgi:hypothetical protein
VDDHAGRGQLRRDRVTVAAPVNQRLPGRQGRSSTTTDREQGRVAVRALRWNITNGGRCRPVTRPHWQRPSWLIAKAVRLYCACSAVELVGGFATTVGLRLVVLLHPPLRFADRGRQAFLTS